MATHGHAVKSLNKGAGRRRFVFKTFSERIEEIDIDVYQSLDPLKSEPSEGSSFFRDCLVQWRELNTAEDFISFYEEMMPLVQTLPQIILQKELILSKLLYRLQIKGRLSLEPILRLIAALSRDVLEDFIPLLQRVANSMLLLLKSGADKDSEIIEQIFTSWSYIMMYLQKYLIRDVVNVLKVTVKLRYYQKDYVQEFMAESMSFLLRNAPIEQLIKGIRKIMFEVVKKPSAVRKSGVSALLFYVMRGFSSRLHSRAGEVLPLLMDKAIVGIGDKNTEGSDTVVEVVITTLQRLCEELQPKKLELIWKCLHEEISDCITNGYLLHLSRILSLLISIVESDYVHKILDFKPLLELVRTLVQTFIKPSHIVKAEDQSSELIDKILQLMLCILDGLYSGNHMEALSGLSFEWAPVFDLRNSSFLTFIKELSLKDPCILHTFRTYIISALADLVGKSEEEVIYIFLNFCERLQLQSASALEEVSRQELSRICNFLETDIGYWTGEIKGALHVAPGRIFQETNLARMWGIISCYSYVVDFVDKPSLRKALYRIMDFVDALDQLLKKNSENIGGFPKHTWESLIGAGLGSYHKLHLGKKTELDEPPVDRFLYFAKTYKSSTHILTSVADFLDLVDGSTIQTDSSHKPYHPELEANKIAGALDKFSENLSHPDKRIRLSTLRILCHYELLNCKSSANDQSSERRMITDDSQNGPVDEQSSNVLQLLHSIEATPLSITTSRKVILLISRIQMALSAQRISEDYLCLVLYGIIGIFHNRFNYLWNPAMECFAVLIGQCSVKVREKCVLYLKKCLSDFLTHHDQSESGNIVSSNDPGDVVRPFNVFLAPMYDSTPCPTVLSSLIQSLQKVPRVIESHSWEIIPSFLQFLGYKVESGDDLSSVQSYDSRASKGKEWRGVLEEWLNLLKLMRNPKSLDRSRFLKEVLQYRLLDENDAEVQLKVLDCLLNWKDDFLLPYDQHLKNLICTKNLREELTTWSLSRESNLIDEQHRGSLVPIVIRILIPKVRKLKTLASRKHASVNHRKAVIGFLAELDVSELPLFFALLIKPLQTVSQGVDAVDDLLCCSPKTLDNFDSHCVLRHFTLDHIKALSSKKLYGFLHVIEEILGVFDESRINPFLDVLMASVVRILASYTPCTESIKNNGSSMAENSNDLSVYEKDGEEEQMMASMSMKQFKDLRSLCLKVIALVLNKYEDHDFSCEFWDMFFTSVKPLIDGFKQEGASSEKPSSLFVCFLAMSRSYKLVSLLYRVKNLVPDIFSILTVTTASEAILSCVLKFIENLLNLDSKLDTSESDVKKILLPNIDALVSSLHCLFTRKNVTDRKLIKYTGEGDLNIFKLLSKYIKDPSAGRKFVDILLPSLTKRPYNLDACLETLKVIQHIIPVLGSESTAKILNTIAPILISGSLDIRLSICDILDALVVKDSCLLQVAKLLREFNATSALEMGGLEYDIIIAAYEKIDINFFCSVREEHALVVLSHCMHDMSSEELILRHSAYRLLLLFVEFSRKILDHELEPDEGSWSAACIEHMINNFLLKHMGYAMNKEASVLKLWMDLLREMVLRLPKVSNLESYHVLCSEDAEQDFFINIIHLQKHRRARALYRFSKVIGAGCLSEVITNKVLVPLLFNMLLDVKDGKGEHLRSACVEALASISGCMGWKPYYALLNRCFREMKLKPDKQKLFLRLICSILDHYHFLGTHPSDEANSSLEDFSSPGTSGLTSSVVSGKRTTTANPSDIPTCLNKTILPKIQKLLAHDTGNVNVNVSLAALKLLKLLPGNIMELQLPNILHRVSNFLKNRLQSVRDEARSALAACLKELGLEYLQFVVKVLRTTLKRGFEVHVLGYTLNFILSKCLLNPFSGKLDYCFEELLSVAENDILGDVSDEKEVEKIASKMKETRKQKSLETLTLIAQSITFRTHALKLLSPVKVHLQKQLTPKLKSKLESMLSHIATGIQCNPSVNHTDLFVFVYGLIEDGIAMENQGSENLSISNSCKRDKDGMTSEASTCGRSTRAGPQCSHLITVFALGILHSRLKNMKLHKKDEHLLSMLDPFVRLLGNCLSSKYEDIRSAALRCLSPLVRLPLPSLESQAEKIKSSLLDFTQGSLSATSPLTESCLRLLTVLLRSTSITLSSRELQMLIQFPLFVDLERNPSFVALSLLKAIVNRKLVVPEIYDLAKRVAELMITSQVEPIRRKCSQIFLQFLLDYCLSEKRLQQHLDFLLANLRYEHPSGREAALEMLHAIIIKFPQEVVDEQSHTVFVELVLCLANDHDNKVRSMTGAAIKLLIGRVSPHFLDFLRNDIHLWYEGGKQALWSAAAQVYGLLVEVTKKDFQIHIDNVLLVMARILKEAVRALGDRKLDLSNKEMVPFWKEAYYSLILLEKILLQFPCYVKKREEIWEMICEFLLHPHMWLRNISSRLLALYFATVTTGACGENGAKSVGDFFLLRPSKLFLIAVSLCYQLKASVTDDAANNCLGQNIVFVVCRLHSMLAQNSDTQIFWSALDDHEGVRFLRAFLVLDSRKGRGMYESLASWLNGQSDTGNIEHLQHLLISSLLKKMGKTALEMEAIQMKIVFDSFKLISAKILDQHKVLLEVGKDGGQDYAYQMLLPLYKICEGFAGKVILDDVKLLAEEVRDSIRDIIGVQNFVQVYSLIRKNFKAKRDKRRQGEKLMAVVNPMRNAKRKLRIAAKHKANKKRKIMSMKFGRWVQ